MADKKDSELAIKSSVVAGDLIPLLDSETAVDADKNKMVAASTLLSFAATEGSWTPAVSGVTLSLSFGYFQVNGKMVTLIFSFTMPTTASGATFFINNAPFTSAAVAGAGKPTLYHGTITKKLGGTTSIDNRLELGKNSVTIAAVSDAAPTGRTLAYFSDEVISGFITYVKD